MKFRELIAYDEDEKEEWELPDWAFKLIIFCVWVIALNLLAVIYINKSEYIYFWDNATYWDISKKIASGALMPDYLSSICDSIGNADYNYVAGLPSALFIKLFGESRLVYVLTLVNMYLVPSMAMIYFLARKLGKAPLLTMSITMFICPAITFMAFIGFADVGGMLGALICFYLYFDKNTDKKGLAVWKSILIGIILVLLMLWRRWYAFFAVSFITAMIADCIINRRHIYPALISGAVAGVILVFGFRDFLVNILLRDYGNLYAGYKFSVATDFKLITRYFGIIYLAALAASTIYCAVKRRDLRPVMMWVQMFVCAAMFMALQTHGQQHLLLYIPSLIVLTVYAIRVIDREWMLVGACALAAISAANVYIPYEQPQSIQEIKYYSPIPSFSMLPRYMENTQQILALKRRLDTIIQPGETLGVLSSSFNMNEDILRNVYTSLGIEQPREDYIVTLPQVDVRDTDLSPYGNVNYVLVANPLQTHLGEDSQRILKTAYESFCSWIDIGTAYEELYDFSTYIGDMEIKLFRRVRDVPDYDYRAFMARYERMLTE